MSDHEQTPQSPDAENQKADTSAKRPSHIAYQVRENGERSFFNNIGAAFAHKDGKGFNLQLEAVPVDGSVTLRSFEERLQNLKNGARTASQDHGHEK